MSDDSVIKQYLETKPALLKKFERANELLEEHPEESLTAARQFVELLLNEIANANSAPTKQRHESLQAFIDRLAETILPETEAVLFDHIRWAGNLAVHNEAIYPKRAKQALAVAKHLLLWFLRTEATKAQETPKYAARRGPEASKSSQQSTIAQSSQAQAKVQPAVRPKTLSLKKTETTTINASFEAGRAKATLPTKNSSHAKSIDATPTSTVNKEPVNQQPTNRQVQSPSKVKTETKPYIEIWAVVLLWASAGAKGDCFALTQADGKWRLPRTKVRTFGGETSAEAAARLVLEISGIDPSQVAPHTLMHRLSEKCLDPNGKPITIEGYVLKVSFRTLKCAAMMHDNHFCLIGYGGIAFPYPDIHASERARLHALQSRTSTTYPEPSNASAPIHEKPSHVVATGQLFFDANKQDSGLQNALGADRFRRLTELQPEPKTPAYSKVNTADRTSECVRQRVAAYVWSNESPRGIFFALLSCEDKKLRLPSMEVATDETPDIAMMRLTKKWFGIALEKPTTTEIMHQAFAEEYETVDGGGMPQKVKLSCYWLRTTQKRLEDAALLAKGRLKLFDGSYSVAPLDKIPYDDQRRISRIMERIIKSRT